MLTPRDRPSQTPEHLLLLRMPCSSGRAVLVGTARERRADSLRPQTLKLSTCSRQSREKMPSPLVKKIWMPPTKLMSPVGQLSGSLLAMKLYCR